MLVKSKLYDNAIQCTHNVYYGFKKSIFYYITHFWHIGIGISNTIVLLLQCKRAKHYNNDLPLDRKTVELLVVYKVQPGGL